MLHITFGVPLWYNQLDRLAQKVLDQTFYVQEYGSPDIDVLDCGIPDQHNDLVEQLARGRKGTSL